MRPALPRLHLISNRQLCGERSLAATVAAAVGGGIGAVQLREKDLALEALHALACELRPVLGAVPLIVNCGGPGQPNVGEVLRAIAPAGIHLPEAAGTIAEARAVAGEGTWIGRSVHSLEDARAAEAAGADYLILGTIFATASKPGRAPAGLALVEAVARAVAVPVIAIGGIDEGNAASVLRAGAHGVAVMSTILTAPDPASAAGRLTAIIEREIA